MAANAEARATAALLLSFSAVVVFLFARHDAIADLVLATLDRFHLDGRGLLDLATKRNMILLCHAILLLILRDAGILGAPARCRAATAATDSSLVVVAASVNHEPICSAPALPRATAAVVWRRPRSSAAKDAGVDDSGRRTIRCRQPRRRHQPAAAAAAAAAAIPCSLPPALTEEPEQGAERRQQPLVSKEIVLVEKATTKCSSNPRVIVADDDDEERDANAAAAEETPELADDSRIQEFIDKQWTKIRQESLQLQLVVRSGSGSQQAAIPTC
ncbi:unnamed protein product [Urochloa humidicola]